ncbi:TetR family transcriptional regulator Mce3R [Pseudonocardia ailaonensis]|uniref:TetR family transcriptional regulator Mce3R n=1 Tax=Pseudonocardia ailaonensis TaxID=367279 RepID=A0ABN2N5D8_9PSEU
MTGDGSVVAATPIRRARQKSRRLAEIIEAGARLMYSRGFASTSVADVTAEVGVAPSALYRYLPGKEKLLAAVLDRRFTDYEDALQDCQGWDDVADRLTPIAVAHRDLGVLWQREARAMAVDDYDALALRLRAIARGISELLDGPGDGPPPIARAWSTISILTSLSYHSTTVSRERLLRLLPQLIRAVGAHLVEGPPHGSWSAQPIASVAPPLADEDLDDTDLAILDAAMRLYGAKGYHQVTMADLGEAVGMAGPSLYHRYDSKSTVLAAVLNRAGLRLNADARGVLDGAADSVTAMRGLLHSYARLVTTEPHVVEALLSEGARRPDGDRRPVAEQHDRYVKIWSRQLRRCVPALPAGEAMARVYAGITVVNDLSRTHSTRAELSVDALCDLAWAAMSAGLALR